MNSAYFVLAHPEARKRAARYLEQEAPDGYVVSVRPPYKSRDQECKYHAMIAEIAQQFLFCDRLWDVDSMKRLLIDQFKRDTMNDDDLKESWQSMGQIELAPTLDRSGVVALGTQSRKFPKKLAAAFIEWLYCFGAQHDIEFSL